MQHAQPAQQSYALVDKGMIPLVLVAQVVHVGISKQLASKIDLRATAQPEHVQ